MPLLGFESTISANERPQTHALDRAVTEIGIITHLNTKYLIGLYIKIIFGEPLHLWQYIRKHVLWSSTQRGRCPTVTCDVTEGRKFTFFIHIHTGISNRTYLQYIYVIHFTVNGF